MIDHYLNYFTVFTFLMVNNGYGVCYIIIYNIVSHNFQFPFRLHDITLVC